MDGFMMRSSFGIAVSSEIMAILAISNDLKDKAERMGKIVVAYNKKGQPVTTADRSGRSDDRVDGGSHQPEPAAEHRRAAGIRARRSVREHSHRPIAHYCGQSGPEAFDYHVTESGFGADIGFEKFWNLKCRFSGLSLNVAVIVATIRALKCHGGARSAQTGLPMPKEI